jgi:hypothetical protein
MEGAVLLGAVGTKVSAVPPALMVAETIMLSVSMT